MLVGLPKLRKASIVFFELENLLWSVLLCAKKPDSVPISTTHETLVGGMHTRVSKDCEPSFEAFLALRKANVAVVGVVSRAS